MSHDDLPLLFLSNWDHDFRIGCRPSNSLSHGSWRNLVIVQEVHINFWYGPGVVGNPWVGHIKVVSSGSVSCRWMPQYGRIPEVIRIMGVRVRISGAGLSGLRALWPVPDADVSARPE